MGRVGIGGYCILHIVYRMYIVSMKVESFSRERAMLVHRSVQTSKWIHKQSASNVSFVSWMRERCWDDERGAVGTGESASKA